jgi:hypothetical protein
MRFPHLEQLDALLAFHEANPQWPITLKSLAAIRVQAFIDLEPLMKEPAIPDVSELDA